MTNSPRIRPGSALIERDRPVVPAEQMLQQRALPALPWAGEHYHREFTDGPLQDRLDAALDMA